MGFPHRGLLRKLRQPARHRCHAPLTSLADLARFTCLDSDILRRLPVALFVLLAAGWQKSAARMRWMLLPRCVAYMSEHLRLSEHTYRYLFLLQIT